MTITGTTFDRMRVTPKDDGRLYDSLSNKADRIIKDYANKMTVTTSGLNLYVDTGAAVVCGRLVEVTEKHKLSLPANTKGFVVITLDLTQTNTSTGLAGSSDYVPVNNQVRLDVVSEIVSQNINDSGTLYTMPIVSYTTNGSTVTVKNALRSCIRLETISGSGWQPYYPNPTEAQMNNWPTMWDFGDFKYLSGHMTRTTSLAAGADEDAFKVPSGSSFDMVGGSMDHITYNGDKIFLIYPTTKNGVDVLNIGKVFSLKEGKYVATGTGGWYAIVGVIWPSTNSDAYYTPIEGGFEH